MNKLNESSTTTEFFLREVVVNYRSSQPMANQFAQSEDVAEFVRCVRTDNTREHVLAIYLDGALISVCYATISIGSTNKATCEPREILQRAVLVGAIALMLAHSLPSYAIRPNNEALLASERIKIAGTLLGIKLVDYLFVDDMEHYSLLEHGQL